MKGHKGGKGNASTSHQIRIVILLVLCAVLAPGARR